MSKIAINNEIVLMRHAVRKSRVALVRKLIKETKLLRARKHGDEKIVEKCKRKADRLAAEIKALKKIKDDEISKFGITLTKSLPEILNDTTAEPNTRVMARLAFHKFLNTRIQQFKEKFPSFEEHLGPGRKKLSKLQRKERREAINRIRAGGVTTKENKDNNEALKNEIELVRDLKDGNEELGAEISHSEEEDESVDDEIKENSGDDEIDGESSAEESPDADHEPGSILRIKNTESSRKRLNDTPETEIEPRELKKSKKCIKNNCKNPKKSILASIDTESTEKLREASAESEGIVKTSGKSKKPLKVAENLEKSKKCIKTTENVEKPKKPIPIKIVSEEATVKSFTDVIEDKESSEPSKNPTNPRKSLKIEKRNDSFFFGLNDESEHVSVVVQEPRLCDEEEEEEQDERFASNHAAKRRKNIHEKNSKFVGKTERRSNHDCSKKFDKNPEQRRQNNLANPRNNGNKYPRQNFVPNSRNSRPDSGKNHDVKDEELHPSWQARKKQQEILKQGFQGKKIVFGD